MAKRKLIQIVFSPGAVMYGLDSTGQLWYREEVWTEAGTRSFTYGDWKISKSPFPPVETK